MMRFATVALALLIALSLSFAGGCRSPKGATVQEKRNYALQMKKDALAELYKQHPKAKDHVARAPGYAVFSSMGSKLFMLATGSGFGVATDNRTGKNTYMRMVEAGGGVGFGIKTYRAVYVFNNRDAFQTFVAGGWQVGGDADVGAEYEDKGVGAGAALTSDELSRPVTVYQFTDKGVSLSAVATGTRYYVDDDLN
jgi:lipid-binding SYLF domain-containing protein